MREVAIVVELVKSRVCRMQRRSRPAVYRNEISLEKNGVKSKMKLRFLADMLGIMG